MKQSIMREMINGFSNSQAKWYSEKVLLLEICGKCVNVRNRMLVYKMQIVVYTYMYVNT